MKRLEQQLEDKGKEIITLERARSRQDEFIKGTLKQQNKESEQAIMHYD